ncbi:MAG TPA: OmpA family protein, partial [Pseudomonadota bacterium]|nr:OmpA family protein [Pseudomonadota bacterium]
MRFSKAIVLCLALACLPGRLAHAQNQGFQLNRYEPTPAGEWSFLVDHPFYSSTRYFAGGVTLNYAHLPLVFGLGSAAGSFSSTRPVIEHQLLTHIDLAGSFLDRVTIAASLPVTVFEKGQPLLGVSPAGGAVGDPRLGVMVRAYGQPDRSPFSISLGATVWIPLRAIDSSLPLHTSEQGVRVLPKLVLGGLFSRLRWSFTAGFLYRPEASLGTFLTPDGSVTGSSIQLGAALGYADLVHRFAIGPEALLSTVVVNGNAFRPDYTSLEVLLGAHYNIARLIQVGVAGGIGTLREPGTPDARALFRLAYAPLPPLTPPRKDRDGDGILDKEDACPLQPGVASPDPSQHGCPPRDRDNDGVADPQDQCPDKPQGPRPDSERPGCPLLDRDRDGILDEQDQCPDQPQGAHPDPARRGCPENDSDGDGLLDSQDQCPTTAQGEHPDPQKPGCPDADSDGDGVYNAQDQCPQVRAGAFPDPQKPGCPQPDKDGDSIVDAQDACPDRPGAPDPNPKKHGCPGLVLVKAGQIVILKSVFFANDQDVILKKSFPVLQAVANVLITQPIITKLAIEGHTDDRGDAAHNTDLSDRRAKAAMRWLVEHGIDASRLVAKGYGPLRPIGDNKTLYGRAKNRRVEFHILEPSTLAKVPAAASPTAPVDSKPAPASDPSEGPEPPPAGYSTAPPPAAAPTAPSAPVAVPATPAVAPAPASD